MRGAFWSEGEKNFLCTHYTSLTTTEIAERLDRTKKGVESALHKLGLTVNDNKKRKLNLRGLSKPVDGASKVSNVAAAHYLALNYDYRQEERRPTVLHVRKDGRRSSSEKVLADIYNLRIIEE